MTNRLIHKGMYKESLRRIRLAVILLTVIPFALTVPLILSNHRAHISHFSEVYALLYALPFLAPLTLTLILFSAQNNRCDSDFYHSLPLTKRSLNLTWLAAVATGLAVVIIGSALAAWALSEAVMTNAAYEYTPLLAIGGAFVASLMVTAVMFLSYSVSGNTVSALFFSAILLFAPMAIVYLISQPMTDYVAVVSIEAADISQYQLLYGNEDSPLAWIVTAAITLVCFLLGLVACNRRRSELAGGAAGSKLLQLVFRLTASYVVCLPAINALWYDHSFGAAALCYVAALAVWFLFELFTTKSAKRMLRSVPWLGLLVALNILTVIGSELSVAAYCRYRPEPDEIRAVSVTSLEEYDATDDAYYFDEITFNPYSDNPDTAYSPDDFWYYESVSDKYNIGNVMLDSAEHRTIACDALERNLDAEAGLFETTTSYNVLKKMAVGSDTEVFFRVTLAYHGTVHTRYRTVWLYSDEFVELFREVCEQADIPRPIRNTYDTEAVLFN